MHVIHQKKDWHSFRKKRELKRKIEDVASISETFPVQDNEGDSLHTDFSHSKEDLQPETSHDKPNKYIDHSYCSIY